MDTIDVVGLSSAGFPRSHRAFGRFNFSLNYSNFTFVFGKSYLLDCWPWHGGDTLSWIIGGALDQFSGKLLKNNLPYTLKERRHEGWCVRSSSVRRSMFSFRKATVQEQIQHGLRMNPNPYFKTEEEFIAGFRLTISRYHRRLRQLSGEGWRASCAIGLANGRRVFCFPYVLPDIINNNEKFYFTDMFDILTRAGALILFPTTAVGLLHPQDMCDEIVPMRPDSDSVVMY